MYRDLSHLPQNKRDDLQQVVEVGRASTAFHFTDRIEAMLKLTEERCSEKNASLQRVVEG